MEALVKILPTGKVYIVLYPLTAATVWLTEQGWTDDGPYWTRFVPNRNALSGLYVESIELYEMEVDH